MKTDATQTQNLAAREHKDRKETKSGLWVFCVLLWLNPALVSSAATLYVWQDSPSPVPPYTNWATAATNIQDAVDAATPGDTVLVADGRFRGSARTGAYAAEVTKPLTLQSVNGPEFTEISSGGFSRGPVSLAAGAVLSGFKVTSSSAKTGVRGAGPSSVVSNCIITLNKQGATNVTLINCVLSTNGLSTLWYTVNYSGSGASRCVLSNCLLVGNQALSHGGGSDECTLNNCTLIGNEAISWRHYELGAGGGAHRSTLNNCTLIGNSAHQSGGGASESWLTNCTLAGNFVADFGDETGRGYGGGASSSTLNHCMLVNNRAHSGGGTSWSTLFNCTLTGNVAFHPIFGGYGGGAWSSTMVHCTVVGNSAANGGGGIWSPWGWDSLTNCIVYFNTAPNQPNYSTNSIIHHSCTTPLPAASVGNIDLDPLLVDTNGWRNLRLQSNSPCINAGNNDFVTSVTDLDGNPRIIGGTVDMGAYEFVFTPAMNLGRLILLVEETDLAEKNKQPLLATLNAALASLTRGNANAASNQLLAFQNKVRAQVAPWNPALADEWTTVAAQVMDGASGR